MNDTYQPKKIFTIESANAILPLVKAITKDLVQLSKEVIERRDRIALLSRGRKPGSADVYSEELAQSEEELEKETRRIYEYVEELRQLGVEPKSGPEGLIDFPCTLDGRLVFLCWKLGELEVQHWHELDGGFAGRQSLKAEMASNGPDR